LEREAERDLVKRLGQGDAAAFDDVYAAYRSRLFAFLVRLSRRRDVAEDLLEETWLRLVDKAGGLPAETRLGPWLFTVARNLFLSYCRSRLLDRERTAELSRLSSEPPWGRTPFEALAADELGRRLEQALAQVSVADRELLLLVGADGLTAAEAAQMLGIAPEALRQRLSRARARLARHLKEEAAVEEATEGSRR